MNWHRGFSALYELRKVDPITWMDTDELRFTAGTVSRSEDDLQESANLTLTESQGECWLRVYLKAKQGNSGARVPVFTGLASTPRRDLDGVRETYQATCYSVLKPADDVLVECGYYVPAGAEGARVATGLLGVGPAPVFYQEDGPKLMEPIVAEDADTHLSIAQQIVRAIGWRIRIGGDGSISIEPPAVNALLTLDAMDHDSVELTISDTQDWYSVPNCYRASTGDIYAIARDDDPDSALSTVSRKALRGGTGEIWASETGVTLSDDKSLGEYVLERLKEAQAPARTVGYTRRFQPDTTVGDLVNLHLARYKIDGVFRISRQTITLGHGCRTQEEVVMV